MSNRARHLSAALLTAAVLALTGESRGQDSVARKGAAEALFVEGREALTRGDYKVACSKFEQSQAIESAVGTLLNLATCYEKLGRSASAWVTYKRAAAFARTRQQNKREAFARTRAEALAPKLAYIVVEVKTPPGNLTLTRNETEIPSELWGKPVPVDPGSYQISVTVGAEHKWSEQAVAKQGKTVRVVVPALSDAGAAAAPTAPAPGAPAAPKRTLDPPAPIARDPGMRDTRPGDTQRTAGLVVGGAGAVSMGVGTIFLLRALSKDDSSKDHCSSDNRCTDKGKELRDEARSSGNIATVFVGAGAAALAGGALLYFTAPSPESTAHFWLGPQAATTGVSVQAGGRF